MRDLVLDLTVIGEVRPMLRGWSVPAAGDAREVFSSEYLAGATRFQASELWTVLTVNGWLSRLEQGAYAVSPVVAAA